MKGAASILLLAGVAFAVVVLLGSRFSSPTVSIGDEGPTVTPSPNESSAGAP